MTPHPEVVPIFVGTWVVLGIASAWVLYFDRNVARKKRLVPGIIIASGVLFAAFATVMTGDLKVAVIGIPAVAVITLLNLRMIKVCPSCGRTIYSGLPFARPEYCSQCGAKLDQPGSQ